VWKLGLMLVWNLGLGTSVGIGLKGQWKLGLGYIGHSYEWKGPKFEKHHINQIMYFLIFFLLKRKDLITIHMSEYGFDLERWKLFYSKRWMSHVCMTWYDVWIFLLHFFENNIRIDSHFIVISNSWNHSTLIFFYFFLNHFFGLINLLTNIF